MQNCFEKMKEIKPINFNSFILIFIFLNILDVVTTYFSIQYFEAKEGNAIVHFFMQTFSVIAGMIILKLIVIMVLVATTLNLRKKSIIWYNIGVSTITFMFIIVVLWNSSQLAGMIL